MLASYFLFSKTTHRLWSKLTTAIVAKDMERATEAKTAVEERERELRRLREESGQQHVQRFFAQNKEGRWIPKFTCVSPISPLYLLRLTLHVTGTESLRILRKRRLLCRTGFGRPHQLSLANNRHPRPEVTSFADL